MTHHTTEPSNAPSLLELQRRVHRWRLVGVGAAALAAGALIAGSGSANSARAGANAGGEIVSFSAGSRTWVAGPEGTVFWRIDGVTLNRVE